MSNSITLLNQTPGDAPAGSSSAQAIAAGAIVVLAVALLLRRFVFKRKPKTADACGTSECGCK